MKIGFIGLGRMGLPMALYTLRGNHEVRGFDPDNARLDLLVAEGGLKCGSEAEVARNSEIVVLLIGNDQMVRKAVFDGKLLEAMTPGSVLVLSDTLWYQTPAEIAQQASSFGVEVLDAPLCRGENAAKKGEILSLIGGRHEVFERCRPVLECYSSDIFTVGDLGAGQIAKSINNYILWACTVANDEAFRLAQSLGVNKDQLITALNKSSAANWALSHLEDVIDPPWAKKDMQLFMRMVDHLGQAAPLAAIVKEFKK